MMTRQDDFRGDALANALRAHSDEMPSTAVDAAILAAARKAVGARPGARFHRWVPLAAAATMAAVAVGLVGLVPRYTSEPAAVSDATSTWDRKQRAANATQSLAERAPEISAERDAVPKSSLPVAAPTAPPAAPVPGRVLTVDAVPVLEPPSLRVLPPVQPEPPSMPPAESPTPAVSMQANAVGNAAPAAAEPIAADAASEPREAAAIVTADAAASLARGASVRAEEAIRGEDSERGERRPSTDLATARRARETSDVALAARSVSRAAEAAAPQSTGRMALRATPTPAPPMARTAKAVSPSPKPMAEFIAEIHRRHQAGDLASAARELRAFREAYADADRHLPVELRTWATGVQR